MHAPWSVVKTRSPRGSGLLAGNSPDSITAVVFPHCHGDPINGVRNKAGQFVLPTARRSAWAPESDGQVGDARLNAMPGAAPGQVGPCRMGSVTQVTEPGGRFAHSVSFDARTRKDTTMKLETRACPAGVAKKRTISLTTLALASLASFSCMAQTLTWSVQPGGVAIAADAAENVFTVDWEYAPAGDIVLTKTAPNGVTLFSVRHNNVDSSRHEVATWVDTDSAGGAYVSGTVRAGYSSPVNANALLMRFGADGTLRWRLVLGTDFDGGSTVKVLRDAADNAYVLGIGPTPSGLRTRIHKVSPAGQVLWMWHDFAGIGSPVNLKWGANGNLVVAARAVTGQLGGAAQVDRNGLGTILLTSIPAYAGIDATADASGRMIVVSIDPATQQGRLVKYGEFGMSQWTQFDAVKMARVEVASDGGIVVGGTPTAGFGVAFLKYAADGTPLWASRDADGPANAFLSHGQMRLDSAGNAYQAAGNMSQMSVTRVNADGSTGWSVLAPFGYGRALAFGAQSQAVYVVGGQVARIDQGGTPPPPPPQLPDLAASLSDAPDPVRTGSNLTYTAVVRNAGTASALAVSLTTSSTLNRPTFVSVTTSQGSCTASATPRCTLGNLAPGASATIRWVVRSRSAGSFTTQAAAITTSQETATGNNTASQTTVVTRR